MMKKNAYSIYYNKITKTWENEHFHFQPNTTKWEKIDSPFNIEYYYNTNEEASKIYNEAISKIETPKLDDSIKKAKKSIGHIKF